MHYLYLAVQYLKHHRARTLFLIVSLSFTCFMPIAIHTLFSEMEGILASRLNNTPLVLGAQGSQLDLCLEAIYFKNTAIPTLKYQNVDELSSPSIEAIPLYLNHSAQGFPIVGTTIDYLEKRQLNYQTGHSFAQIGECVIGSKVAKHLKLSVGDHLLSNPKNAFNIAANFPLKMKITGILSPTLSPDDHAIFTDLKTTWIIDGYGHGHQNLVEVDDNSLLLSKSAKVKVASSKLIQYNEITEHNRASFHFHQNSGQLPISAICIFPETEKDATFFEGDFLDKKDNFLVIRPKRIIQNLLNTLVKTKTIVFIVVTVFILSVLLALFVVLNLLFGLRKSERNTMYKIGCSTKTVVLIHASELGIIGICVLGILGLLYMALIQYIPFITQLLIH